MGQIDRSIVRGDRQSLLMAARVLSKFEDKSHPIDGLAFLLIEDKKILSPPSFAKKIEQSLRNHVGIISQDWGPRLRYRAIQATAAEANRVLESVRWILEHCPKH